MESCAESFERLTLDDLPDPAALRELGAVAVDIEPPLAEAPRTWPVLEFEFSEQNLFGSPTLPTNPAARTLTVVRATIEATDRMRSADPERFPPGVMQSSRELESRIKEANKLLGRQRTIGDTRRRYMDFVPFDEAMAELWPQLVAENHPYHQAIERIRELNEGRPAKSSTGAPMPRMGEADFTRLKSDILKFTFTEEIEAYYLERLKNLPKEV